MLDIGVQTKGIIPEMDIDKGFGTISEAGFTRVDINIDTFLKNSDLYAGKVNKFFDASIEELTIYFNQYTKAMDKYGIRPSQMHAPYPVRVEGKNKQNDYMQGVVIPKSILIANMLGVPWVVIHPFKMQYPYNKDIERKMNITYFQMLIPLLKEYNVGVCFENLYEGMGGRIVEGVCADPYDVVCYIDTLNEMAGQELFGLCLDTGHLQLVKRDPYEYIKVVGNRLKALHIHENDSFNDIHQMPYTFGDCSYDGQNWNSLFRGLKAIGYEGTLSYETFPCVNSFPRNIRGHVLNSIHEIGVYMKECIETEML